MYIHAMVDDSRGWPAMAVRVGVGGMVVWMDGRLNKMFSNKEKENDENEGRIRKRENKNKIMKIIINIWNIVSQMCLLNTHTPAIQV